MRRLVGGAAIVTLSPLLDLAEIVPAPSLAWTRTGIMIDEMNRVTWELLRPFVLQQFLTPDPFVASLRPSSVGVQSL